MGLINFNILIFVLDPSHFFNIFHLDQSYGRNPPVRPNFPCSATRGHTMGFQG